MPEDLHNSRPAAGLIAAALVGVLSACGPVGNDAGTSAFASVANGSNSTGSTNGTGTTGTATTTPAACTPAVIPADSSTTTCASFCFQEDAQLYYQAFSAFQLDGIDQDGIACEHLKHKPATGP